MIIELSKLSPEGNQYDGDDPPEILDFGDDVVVKEAPEPVHYELFAQIVSRELIVQGQISTSLRVSCARCTELCSTSVADSSFLRAYDIAAGEEVVDLAPDFREAILLNLPAFPMCAADCAGLCPHCGINLNRTRCECAPEIGGWTWGALDALNPEDEGR
jgi:uncharacterized protein